VRPRSNNEKVVKRIEELGIEIDKQVKLTLRELAAQRKRLEHFEIAVPR